MEYKEHENELKALTVDVIETLSTLTKSEAHGAVSEDASSFKLGKDYDLSTSADDLRDSLEFEDNFEREVYYASINKTWTDCWDDCQAAFDEYGFSRTDSIMTDIQTAVNSYLNQEARDAWDRAVEVFSGELGAAQDKLRASVETFASSTGIPLARIDEDDLYAHVVALAMANVAPLQGVKVSELQSFLQIPDSLVEKTILDLGGQPAPAPRSTFTI